MELTTKISDFKVENIPVYCDEKGKLFKTKGMTTSQIRNIFSHISSIRTQYKKLNPDFDNIKRQIVLLKPMIAYAKGRQKDEELTEFHTEMNKLIKSTLESFDSETRIKNKSLALDNFFAIVEGFIAYHKFYGGK